MFRQCAGNQVRNDRACRVRVSKTRGLSLIAFFVAALVFGVSPLPSLLGFTATASISEKARVWEHVQAQHIDSHPLTDGQPGAVYLVFEEVCPACVHYPASRLAGLLHLGTSSSKPCEFPKTHTDVPKHYCETENCHALMNNSLFDTSAHNNAIVCVACSEGTVALLRRYTGGTLILPSADDYEEMVWLESVTPYELLLWPRVSFTISVISTCRLNSLRELLSSITSSYFFGDRVDLYVSLDTSPTQECLEYLSTFEWPRGSFQVRRRIRASGGPEVAVPEGLSISGGDGHYGVLLEDDILVSQQFYSWLKFVGLQLTGYPKATSQRIFSISLYTPRVLETGKERRTWIDYEASSVKTGSVFLFEVPCSWGSAFAATYWSKALSYFEVRLTGKEVYERVRDSKASTWTGSWKKWLIELGYHLHWKTVYPVFQDEMSFSTNTLQDGKHMVSRSALDIDMFMVPLFTNSSWYSQLREKRLFQNLRAFNMFLSPQKM